MVVFEGQVLGEHPHDRGAPARHTQFTIQPLKVRVNRMPRDAQCPCDRGLRLVIEYGLNGLQLSIGQRKSVRKFLPLLLRQD